MLENQFTDNLCNKHKRYHRASPSPPPPDHSLSSSDDFKVAVNDRKRFVGDEQPQRAAAAPLRKLANLDIVVCTNPQAKHTFIKLVNNARRTLKND
uniref:Uncharacterized protein n=1 Tax=Romanomermis culicivorax TaxID=13658 RepID=A0A915IZ45_ROMCU